jgi:hypothetical protein
MEGFRGWLLHGIKKGKKPDGNIMILIMVIIISYGNGGQI